jgi:penicillin-binding protein 1A
MTQQRIRRRKRRRAGVGTKLLVVLGGLLAVVAIAVIAVTSWVLDVAADAPPLGDCKPIGRGGDSTVYAADGSRLGRINASVARVPVSIERIPKTLQRATVAIEDQRFYEHSGVDDQGILRAAVTDLEKGEAVEGGSTITQQLVRNLCIQNPERNLERKIIEAKLAQEYFEKHTRKEILGSYLNIASYGTIEGSTAVGVGAAAKIFFSKPVWKLDLPQVALLAGLPQAPSEYNPIINPRAAKARRNEVLAQMAKQGYVTHDRARAAARRGLGLDVSQSFFHHRQPYFFDYVEDRLLQHYGVNTVRRGGLDIHTTIDLHLQEVGKEAMETTLPYSTDPASALVSIDPRNGHIKAMVSSSSYAQSQFNLAAQGHRQPGSTFKAFVLTTAIKQGIDPYSTYYTSKPLELHLPKWGEWNVHTADEGYQGTINLQQATVTSDNTVFAQLDLDVGPENVAQTAKSMGITTELDGIPAEGIGGLRIGVSPLELTDAYATLASGGVHHDPVAIEKVVFPNGHVDHPEGPKPERVLSRPVAWEVTRLLHDNITEGTGTAAYTGCAGEAGKTGTTDRETDAWFAGYTPRLATAVWVGYPESNAIEMTDVHGITVFGGTFPAEIWNKLYTGGEIPCDEFTEPSQTISWSPYYGQFTSGGPDDHGSGVKSEAQEAEESGEAPPGTDAVGGYDPNAYAPGAGQEPAPLPPPLPSTGGGPSTGVGGGESAGQ